jgi:hypothetical protein
VLGLEIWQKILLKYGANVESNLQYQWDLVEKVTVLVSDPPQGLCPGRSIRNGRESKYKERPMGCFPR